MFRKGLQGVRADLQCTAGKGVDTYTKIPSAGSSAIGYRHRDWYATRLNTGSYEASDTTMAFASRRSTMLAQGWSLKSKKNRIRGPWNGEGSMQVDQS